MIGYTTIGTQDMDRAVAFYEALLAEIGAKLLFGMDRIKFFGNLDGSESMLSVCIPYDEQPQTPGNGCMIAIPGGSEGRRRQALRQGHRARRHGRRPAWRPDSRRLLRRVRPRPRRQQALLHGDELRLNGGPKGP